MTSTTSQIHTLSSPDQKYEIRVSPSVLIGVYLIIPILIGALALDQIFLNELILKSLPKSPEDLFIFTLFFVSPHVYASLLNFADQEYLKFYKKKVRIVLPLLFLVCFVSPYIIGKVFFGIFLTAWTVKHVINQQFSLAPLLTKEKSKYLFAWQLMGLYLGILMYASLMPEELPFKIENLVIYSILVLAVPFAFITWKISQTSKSKNGKLYVWANFFMIGAGLYFYFESYTFFGILAIRLIHDITAFYFYFVHDLNRNSIETKNSIYRFFRRFKIPVAAALPILSITLALPTSFRPVPEILYSLFAFVTLAHYYVDSVIWKAGSPQRAHVKLSPT